MWGLRGSYQYQKEIRIFLAKESSVLQGGGVWLSSTKEKEEERARTEPGPAKSREEPGKSFPAGKIRAKDKDVPEIAAQVEEVPGSKPRKEAKPRIVHKKGEESLETKEKKEMARNYEDALRYEDAAKLYGPCGLWKKAGRVRMLQIDLTASRSIFQSSQYDYCITSIEIKDSVIHYPVITSGSGIHLEDPADNRTHVHQKKEP